MMPTTEQVLDKFTVPEPNSGCLLWTGARLNSGYGNFRGTTAHRWVYENSVGPIPEGLDLHHKCNTRPCVNRNHLEPATRSENVRAYSDLKTECIRGHEFTVENTYVTPQGWRECRACKRMHAGEWRAAHPDKVRENNQHWHSIYKARREIAHA